MNLLSDKTCIYLLINKLLSLLKFCLEVYLSSIVILCVSSQNTNQYSLKWELRSPQGYKTEAEWTLESDGAKYKFQL